MENVWEEKDVDILRFPTPRYNIHDGGRYIGTGHLTITRIRKKVGSISALTASWFTIVNRWGCIFRRGATRAFKWKNISPRIVPCRWRCR